MQGSESCIKKEVMDNTFTSTRLGQQHVEEMQSSECPGSQLELGNGEHIPGDHGQPLRPLERINLTNLSSSSSEQRTSSLLQNGVGDNVSDYMKSSSDCILSSLSSISSTVSSLTSTPLTADLESAGNILENCGSNGFSACLSSILSTSTTVSKTVSSPDLKSPGNILQLQTIEGFSVCTSPLSSTSTTVSKTALTQDLKPGNILQSGTCIDRFPVCKHHLSSTTTKGSQTVSKPGLKSGNIVQSCSSDGFPVVSSVFSLKGVQPTTLSGTEQKRTNPLTDKHSDKEFQSTRKKKKDDQHVYYTPMFVAVSSINLQVRQLSVLHECTLLTFILEAQGGFLKGRKFITSGLKTIFNTLQSHRCELTFQELTKMCYDMFANKMKRLNIERSKIKGFLDALDSFLYLFTWYCHKNWPVLTVAMCVYLPNAADYRSSTWHGMCPTGWSEYCCAVIIREVIQFILDNMKASLILPPYSPEYFSTPSAYSANLLPRSSSTIQNSSEDTRCCQSSASCSSTNQASKVFKGSCADTGNTGTVHVEAGSKEAIGAASNIIPHTPRPTMTVQSSAARYINILHKEHSTPGSVNKQLGDQIACKDCALNTECSSGLKNVIDVLPCRKDIETRRPEPDVPVDGNCHNSSSSLKTDDAPCLLGDVDVAMTTKRQEDMPVASDKKTTDDAPCLPGNANGAMTTKIKKSLNAENDEKRDKTRKRSHLTCFIDEGEKGVNNSIKIRIKMSPKDNLDLSNPKTVIYLRAGSDSNKEVDNESLPPDDTPIDSGEADGTRLVQILGEQKAHDIKEEMEDEESCSKSVESVALKVTGVGCDVTESDVMMAESKVMSDSEDKSHDIETRGREGRDEMESTANQVASNVTVAQSHSFKALLSSHCKDSSDIKGFTTGLIRKRSRLFDALWSNRTPREPRIYMPSGSWMSLREFLERYPLALICAQQNTTIEIDDNTYSTYEVLHHFYTGVYFQVDKPVLGAKRSKICYGLRMVNDSYFVTSVKPISRNSIGTAISQKVKNSVSPTPRQKSCEDELGKLVNKGVNTEVTIKIQDACDHSPPPPPPGEPDTQVNGDGNTITTSSNLQGNTQSASAQEQVEGMALLQQISNLRRTANFLNEMATGLEARLISGK